MKMKVILVGILVLIMVVGTSKTKNRMKMKSKLDSSAFAKYQFNTDEHNKQDGAAPPPPDTPKDPAAVVDQAGTELSESEKSDSQKDIDEIIKNLEKNGVKLQEEQKIEIARNYMTNKKSMIKTQLKLYQGLKEPTKMFTEGRLDSDIPHIVLENANNIPVDANDMATEKECQYKSGFLAYITEIAKPNSIRAGSNQLEEFQYPIMYGKVVYAVLNKDSLSLFEKEHVNSLIKTFDIMHLRPAYYENEDRDQHCFQLVSENKVVYNKIAMDKGVNYLEPGENVMATLCTRSADDQIKWQNAIVTFHNCNVKIVKDEEIKVKPNFNYLTDRLKKLKTRIKEEEKVDKEFTKSEDDTEVLMVKRQVEEMKKAIAQKKAQEEQNKRAMSVKLENDIKKATDSELEEECVQKTLQIQGEEEERAVEMMIQHDSETREQRELKEKEDRILKLMEEQGKNIALEEETLDETIKRMTKAMQYNMVQSIENFEKVIDPTMCYMAEFDFPKGVETIEDRRKHICTQMIDITQIDIDSINSCLVPEFFCDVCCNYNIGASDEVGREQCVERCRGQLGGKDTNVFELDYVLEVNIKKIDALREEQEKKRQAEQDKILEQLRKEEAEKNKKDKK